MKGYVRKRGSKWSYTVDIGRDPLTGKRKQKTKSGFDTKKAASAALTELLAEVNRGTWIEPQNIMVKDFAWEWFENYQYSLRATTAYMYKSKIKNYIVPFFLKYKVQEVKPIHGQAFSKKLLGAFKSPDTAHKTLAIAKLIFNHAVNLELIHKNPLNNITIKIKKKEVSTWTFEELNRFLEVAKADNPFYYRIYVIAAFTGMRKGEILGLSRINVDFKENIISVKQSVAETKEKGVHIGPVKTPASIREIKIDDFVSSILKEQIKENNVMRLKLGSNYQDNGLIFCHPDGKIFRPTGINRPFRRFIKLSGVKYIRFHDMRHTHASLSLFVLKVNAKLVADRLGHSTAKITLDTYGHPTLDMQSELADSFSKHARNS